MTSSMPSPRSSQPKSCLKRPSVFPVARAADPSDSDCDHEYDVNSSSMRDWDSLFGPRLANTPSISKRRAASSIISTSSSDLECPPPLEPRKKRVSFRDADDVRVFHYERNQPSRPRSAGARLLQLCADAFRLDSTLPSVARVRREDEADL